MKKTYIENVHLMMTQEFMTSIKKKKKNGLVKLQLK